MGISERARRRRMREGSGLSLVCFVAALALVASSEVYPLEGGAELGEGAELASAKSKVWSKTGKVPPNTSFYKTLKGFEHHGKCRFACYQEKACGGYSWVPATHTCKLFAAPNFLITPFSNDKWHKAAAQVATAKKIAGKKTKPIHKRTPTVNGHVHLGLDKIANVALKRDAKKSTKGGKIAVQLEVKKTKLYSEFVAKYNHEYTAHAERVISKRAHAIADRRVKKLNKKHKKKVSSMHALALYKQAKKEVEGHAVRQTQRRFKKRLKAWVNAKLYDK